MSEEEDLPEKEDLSGDSAQEGLSEDQNLRTDEFLPLADLQSPDEDWSEGEHGSGEE